MQQLEQYFDHFIDPPDGIKKLRELILTLAMQGKLVEQDPNDQPASELIKEIESEKKRLIAKGTIKKVKPLPEISADEVPYELPAGWEWVRLGNLEPNFQNGLSKRVGKHGNDVYVIRLADIVNRRISLYAGRKIKLTPDECEKYSLHENDFLVTRVNGSADIVGSLTLVTRSDVGVSYCDHFIRMQLSIEAIYHPFLNQISISRLYRDQVKRLFVSTAGQKTVNQKHISNIIFPLPPLNEQTRIVQKIDSLMALCDQLEARRNERDTRRLDTHASAIHHLIHSSSSDEFRTSWKFITDHFSQMYSVKENVEELKKAILTLAMQGKLVEQDPNDKPASELIKEIESEKKRLIAQGKIKKAKPLPEISADEVPYDLPAGWEWVRLSEIGQINPKNESAEDVEAGFVPMTLIEDGISNKHSHDVRIWKDIKKGYTHLADGDIGLAKITPCFENRKSCVFSGLPNGIGAGTTELHIFRNILPNILDAGYLLYYLKNPSFIAGGKSNMTGTAGQQRVPKTYFADKPFPLPPFNEQTRIVQKIDSLMSLCDSLIEQIESQQGQSGKLVNAVLARV